MEACVLTDVQSVLPEGLYDFGLNMSRKGLINSVMIGTWLQK